MSFAQKTFLVTKELARYLGMSPSWLEKARGEKKGPPYHKVGAKVLYRKSDVDRWLESNRLPGGRADV